MFVFVETIGGDIESGDIADVLLEERGGLLKETDLRGEGLDGIGHKDSALHILQLFHLLSKGHCLLHQILWDLQMLKRISRDRRVVVVRRHVFVTQHRARPVVHSRPSCVCSHSTSHHITRSSTHFLMRRSTVWIQAKQENERK